MNSLMKIRSQLVLSIVTKTVLYLGWIPFIIMGHMIPPFLMVGFLLLTGSVINIIINMEYHRIPYVFYLNFYYNKKHGYFFYRTTEDSHDVDIIIYENKYIYWNPITRISIPHKDMQKEGKEKLIYQKIDKALDKEFTSLQEKEKAKRNRIRNKKEVNNLLSPKIEDNNEKFINELKKLEND